MVAVILMGMTAFAPTSKLLDKSQLAPPFLAVGRAAIWLAPSELRARFNQGLDLLHSAPQKLTGSPASLFGFDENPKPGIDSSSNL